MGLYLNGQKYKLHIGNSVALVLATIKKFIGGLMTSNNLLLTDSNGLYLVAKEDK